MDNNLREEIKRVERHKEQLQGQISLKHIIDDVARIREDVDALKKREVAELTSQLNFLRKVTLHPRNEAFDASALPGSPPLKPQDADQEKQALIQKNGVLVAENVRLMGEVAKLKCLLTEAGNQQVFGVDPEKAALMVENIRINGEVAKLKCLLTEARNQQIFGVDPEKAALIPAYPLVFINGVAYKESPQ